MDLETVIWRWARRYCWLQSLWWMPFGLVIGLAVAVILAALARLVPLLRTDVLSLIAITLALAGVLGGMLLPWLRHGRASTLDWARQFDRQFGLADRLSTALESTQHDPPESLQTRALRALQQQDAEHAAARAIARTSQVLPFRFAWRVLTVVFALCVVLVLLLVLPNRQDEVLAQREQERAFVAEQMQQLEQARQIIEQSSLSPEQKARARQAIEQAQRQINDAAGNPEAMLAAMNEARDQLRALQDDTAQQRAEQLHRAGRSLAADDLTRPLAEALAQGDLKRAADLLNNLITDSPQQGRELSPEEVDRLARQLEQFAREVAGADPELARNLRKAAQQLRRGDAQAARQTLSEAAQSLRRVDQARQQQQMLDEALARTESARQAAARRAGVANTEQAGRTTEPEGGQAGQIGNTGQPAASQPAVAQPQAQGGIASPDVGSENGIWQPQRLQESGTPVQLESGQAETTQGAQSSARPAPEGGSVVPYQQVYRQYAQAADEAVSSGAIPLERRELVRRYFSALDPQRGRR